MRTTTIVRNGDHYELEPKVSVPTPQASVAKPQVNADHQIAVRNLRRFRQQLGWHRRIAHIMPKPLNYRLRNWNELHDLGQQVVQQNQQRWQTDPNLQALRTLGQRKPSQAALPAPPTAKP
jgi:hypothetical protein